MTTKAQSENGASGILPPNYQPIYLAPLRGVTDAIFRDTYAMHFGGIDLAVAPFITTHTGRRIKPAHVRDLRPEDNTNMPVVPQVLTKNAEDFITLADHLLEMGYGTVNLNCGCPFPQVANKGRGSGLLCEPAILDRLLNTVLSKMANRLSVKIRLGRRHAEEIHGVMEVLNRYPLESVTIHPRTGIQMYDGTPDLESFAWCLENCRHPVVYNGDIRNRSDFQRLASRFEKVDGWMIGRGVLANPFLPAQLKTTQEIDAMERIKRFRIFHDTLFDRYQERLSGPGHLLDRMKGLWKYFAQGMKNSEAGRKRIHKSRSIEQYEDAVSKLLGPGLKWVA